MERGLAVDDGVAEAQPELRTAVLRLRVRQRVEVDGVGDAGEARVEVVAAALADELL